MKDKTDIRLEIDAIYDECEEDEPSAVERAKLDALDWLIGNTDPITENSINTYILKRMPTEEELQQTISELRQERQEIPKYSLFGDPNWRMIDAQIEILEWVLTVE